MRGLGHWGGGGAGGRGGGGRGVPWRAEHRTPGLQGRPQGGENGGGSKEGGRESCQGGVGVGKGDQGRDSGPRRLDVPGQVELQQTLWNDIVIHKLKVEDIFKNDQKTWRMCSTKSGAITAERSQSSLESRRNSHS